VFIVRWDGSPPVDKRVWIEVLRETLAGELGSYRVMFAPARGEGWRFELEWRADDQVSEDGLIANSPDSVAFNILHGLLERGLPIDASWTPGPGDVRDASSSPAARPTRRSSETRTRRDR
jgi:hypothetical protein